MNETDKEKKDQATENYMKAQMDSFQMQLNAQRTRMEVLEKRVTRIANKQAIHLNNKTNNDDEGVLDV